MTWKLYYWFSSPEKVSLALLVVAVVALVASKPRYRRRMVIASVAMLAAYWFVLSPLFAVPATALLNSFVPPDTGEPADAIVVLARNGMIQGDRYNTALDMVAEGRSPNLLIMGRSQGGDVLKAIDERDLSPNLMLSAVCVRTTKQEAESAAAALGARGLNRIILITDTPHMLRAWLTFKGLGFSVIPHVEPLPAEVGSRAQSLLAIREYLGLVSYAGLGRFQGESPQTLPEVAREMAEDFPADRCFMTAEQLRQAFMLS
ncbi:MULTISPECIES: ElyC/SanA/YdcF family protein [Cyanophyceae]|uniref:YdcF family protein n=1 Tax=Cyanophyceae TaxID=3028117 RepID=UPI001688C968|nr:MULTISPECIES: ElyC/SanA/YdcF family protein [Cyanophyceae]MBD1918969.1 YdcF family protein [Phormidium sp. FACHB-77]MBD2033189.1 YdcF family protein [Phormidium sp. FACHB-322]MBD2053878.1 YdcF family protein [Leptolyngbya sp. FACHB-60]